jgi:predicted transcriptional regulator
MFINYTKLYIGVETKLTPMKVLAAMALLFVVSSTGIGALLSHGPQLNAISWSHGTFGASDSWSPDMRLTDAQLDSRQPAVARDASDNLHVVWSDDRTGESDIYYKKVEVTGNEMVPDQRLSGTASQSIYPAIASDPYGGMHIAWLDDRGGMWNVYYARLDNDGQVMVDGLQLTSLGIGARSLGDSLAVPQPVQTLNHLYSMADIEGMRPSIAVDGYGSAHIAWCDFRNGNSEVRYSVIDQTGKIAIDQARISLSASDSYNAVLRVRGDEIIVLWAERSGETNTLNYARMDLQGTILVPPRPLFSERSQRMEMAAAVDTDGGTRLVWSSDRYVNHDLFYMRLSPDGEPLERETQLTQSMLNSVHPSIAADTLGDVHLVWSEEQDRPMTDRNTRSEIFYAVIGPDGTAVLAPERMTCSLYRSWGPSMALSTSDLPSVVWSDCREGAANSELYLKSQVELTINDVQSGASLAAEPGQDYIPVAAAAGGIGAIIAVALAGAGKYKLSLLAIPLYSRLKKEGLLNHAVREQIFGYVNNHPGANFSQIMKELKLKNGVLAYHLNTLEREELIRSLRDGTYRRYYPRSGRDVPFEIQRTIIERIARMPGIPEGFLADELGISRQVLDYHLDHLVQSGHIRMERRGKRNLLYNTQVAA